MDFLSEILKVKNEEVCELKKRYSFSSYSNFEFWNAPTLNFRKQLLDGNGIKIIAEIKKASPSKGQLLENFNHLQIAKDYITAGADAISVLTDKHFFQGNISFINDIAGIKNIPLLRKDFIIDEHQIFEAKANGADIVLLIAEALSQMQINDLSETAADLGLNVLIELHGADQLEKINFENKVIVGINNRDLVTFKIDLNTTLKLKEKFPINQPIISESGILSKADVTVLKNSKVNGFLIGELLMKADNRQNKLKQIKTWCENGN